MTSQTPHARALEAALNATVIVYDSELENIVHAYLRTLLDSPEMVEKAFEDAVLAYAKANEAKHCPDHCVYEASQAVIAAIKKEASC